MSRRAAPILVLLTVLGGLWRVASFGFNAWPHGDVVIDAAISESVAWHGRLLVPFVDVRYYPTERFGFGYAPDSRNALKTALKQFDESMLIEAGLRIAAEEREPYDRFRGRLTIPIHDARGRVIGFAARILDADKKDAPKYLNSPDTPLFDKGRTLFSLHRAGPASRKSGRMVVVEGQMDVVAMAAAGFEETVAPMGTALIGHRSGDEFVCAMPGVVRRLRIEQVLHQPEAAQRAEVVPIGARGGHAHRRAPSIGYSR